MMNRKVLVRTRSGGSAGGEATVAYPADTGGQSVSCAHAPAVPIMAASVNRNLFVVFIMVYLSFILLFVILLFFSLSGDT